MSLYKGIRDDFSDQYIDHFFLPIIYKEGTVLETSDDLLKCYCDIGYDRGAALRTTFPICGQYKLWFKFMISDSNFGPDFFVIYDTSVIPKPNTLGTLKNTMKLEFNYDTVGSTIDIFYYDTSNVIQNLDINNVASEDKWYYCYLEKTSTNYIVTIFNADMTILTGPSSIALTLVNNGTNPDFSVWGMLAIDAGGDDIQRIDMDLDFVDLKFDVLATNYSNGKHHWNSRIKGV